MITASGLQRVWCVGAMLALSGCLESAWAQSRAGGDAGRRAVPAADASADARRTSRAVTSGAIGVLTSVQGFDSLDGGTLGALMGDQIGEAFGSGGLGRPHGYGGIGVRGTGAGGGGTGEGTIGLGSIGTIGRGGGTGTGAGYGTGYGRLGSGPRGVVRAAPPALEGAGLPREVIRRVVLRNLGAFRFCYERAGATDAGVLSARVSFVIKPDGAVSDLPTDLTITGVPTDLAQCLSARFRAMAFPSTSDGSRVRVVYPIVFDMAP